jgi:hypothetical protein
MQLDAISNFTVCISRRNCQAQYSLKIKVKILNFISILLHINYQLSCKSLAF